MSHEFPDIERIASASRDGFGRGRALVVGDMMLDRYLWGSVERVSPEAPAPVLRERRQSERAGGAGNVAVNLAGLGIQVSIAGFVGDDIAHTNLASLLAERGVDTSAVISIADRPTTTKTRVIAGHQHVLRLDAEELSPVGAKDQTALALAAIERMPVDTVVLADYGKGVFAGDLCERLITAARDAGTPVLVKPKGKDFSRYAGATALSCNMAELSLASGLPVTSDEQLVAASRVITRDLGLDFIIVTRGAAGVTRVDPDRVIQLPAQRREVFDVSGAGDSAVASVAASMIGGLGDADMLHLINVVAGFVVRRVGTVAIDQASLLHLLHDEEGSASEILHRVQDVVPIAEAWHAGGQRIVFVSGTFDGIRADDVRKLRQAAHRGDKLVVGVITEDEEDDSVEDSTIMEGMLGRASVVAQLNLVDTVVLCNARNQGELIGALRPDIVVDSGRQQ